MGEGHDAYHPVKKTGTYDSQIEAAKPQIKMFQERLPKYRNSYYNNNYKVMLLGT